MAASAPSPKILKQDDIENFYRALATLKKPAAYAAKLEGLRKKYGEYLKNYLFDPPKSWSKVATDNLVSRIKELEELKFFEDKVNKEIFGLILKDISEDNGKALQLLFHDEDEKHHFVERILSTEQGHLEKYNYIPPDKDLRAVGQSAISGTVQPKVPFASKVLAAESQRKEAEKLFELASHFSAGEVPDYLKAIEHYKLAIETLKNIKQEVKLQTDEDNVLRYERDLASTLVVPAKELSDSTKDEKKAIESYKEAMVIIKKLVAKFGDLYGDKDNLFFCQEELVMLLNHSANRVDETLISRCNTFNWEVPDIEKLNELLNLSVSMVEILDLTIAIQSEINERYRAASYQDDLKSCQIKLIERLILHSGLLHYRGKLNYKIDNINDFEESVSALQRQQSEKAKLSHTLESLEVGSQDYLHEIELQSTFMNIRRDYAILLEKNHEYEKAIEQHELVKLIYHTIRENQESPDYEVIDNFEDSQDQIDKIKFLLVLDHAIETFLGNMNEGQGTKLVWEKSRSVDAALQPVVTSLQKLRNSKSNDNIVNAHLAISNYMESHPQKVNLFTEIAPAVEDVLVAHAREIQSDTSEDEQSNSDYREESPGGEEKNTGSHRKKF